MNTDSSIEIMLIVSFSGEFNGKVVTGKFTYQGLSDGSNSWIG